MEAEGRIRRSWRLTRTAWELIKRDRTMQVLAVLGTVFAAIAGGLIFWLGGYYEDGDQGGIRLLVIGAVAVYCSTFVSVFFNVALAAAAGAAMEGRRIGLHEALSLSRARLGSIAVWSLLTVGVGFLLEQIASRIPGGGRLAEWLAGAAWALATIFVVPILALETIGTPWAVRKSFRLFRQRWGEGVSGTLTITAWQVVATVPLAMATCMGVGIAGESPAVGVPIVAGAVVAWVAVYAFAAATRQVFGVALYRYATVGSAPGFLAEDLQEPFSKRPSLSHSRIWGWIAVGIVGVFLLAIIAAAVGPRDDAGNRGAGSPGLTPPTTYVADLPTKAADTVKPGVPVYSGDDRVGEVSYVTVANGRLEAQLEIDPDFAETWYRERPRTTVYRARHDPSVVWFAARPRYVKQPPDSVRTPPDLNPRGTGKP